MTAQIPLESRIGNVIYTESLGSKMSISFESTWGEFQNRQRLMTQQRQHPRRKMKLAAIVAVGIILPLAGFTYATYVNWGGAFFANNQNLTSPLSQFADPSYLSQELAVSGTKTFGLNESRDQANFTVYEPASVSEGWKKVLSEGVIAPLRHYTVDGHGNKTYVTTTDGPLVYLDVYENDHGQRVAVEQKYDGGMTKAWQTSQGVNKAWKGSVNWVIGKNTSEIGGFSGNYAFTVHSNWSDVVKGKPGEFTNLVVIHPTGDRSVTDIVIDEYGGVDGATLQKFAKSYLDGNTK